MNLAEHQRASLRLAAIAPVARAIQVEHGHPHDPCDVWLWAVAVALWRGTQYAATDMTILRGDAWIRRGRKDATGYNAAMAPVLAEGAEVLAKLLAAP